MDCTWGITVLQKTVFSLENILYLTEITNYNSILIFVHLRKFCVGILDLQTFAYNSRPLNTLKLYVLMHPI